MHGVSPGSAFLVNAEVDSMGGVIDGGAFVDSKTSPRRAAIEKAQAELRQEYDVREERRRELEFLEKGGNPLDFKIGPAASISVQSTSVTDRHTEHEAKGSFALTASPHGDSVDSSARPVGREPTTADNLLLFDDEDDTLHVDRNAIRPSEKGDVTPSEQLSRLDRSQNAKESQDSPIFRLGVKSQAYTRRNRSRSSRDIAHARSTNLVPTGHNNRSSILQSSDHNSRNGKGPGQQKDHTVSSICNSKTTSPNTNVVFKITASDNRSDMELGAEQAHEAVTGPANIGLSGGIEIGESGSNHQPHRVEEKGPNDLSPVPTGLVGEGENGTSAAVGCTPSAAVKKKENIISVGEVNGFVPNRDEDDLKNEAQNNRNCSVEIGGIKGLDSEFSSNQINRSLDENIVSNQCSMAKKVSSGSNGVVNEQTSVLEATPAMSDADVVEEDESRSVDVRGTANDALTSVSNIPFNSDVQVKAEDEICNSRSHLQGETKSATDIEGMKPNQLTDDSNSKQTNACPEAGLPYSLASSNRESLEATFPVKVSTTTLEFQDGSENCRRLANKEHEDAILEEARKIEASRRMIGELSLSHPPPEKRRKSHWDFVLEEMAWLANDFMQERVWKTTAAAQISKWIAFNGRLKFNEENLCRKQKKVARSLAKAVLQFWLSVELHQDGENQSNELNTHEHDSASTAVMKANGMEIVDDKIEEPMVPKDASKDTEEINLKQSLPLDIRSYALRFLKYSRSSCCSVQAEAPMTPERMSDAGILQLSCEDQYSEESLFYMVPPGAMEVYRKSVESQWAQHEKIGNSLNQEEIEASLVDSAAEFEASENADEEDEGETSIYYSPVTFEGNRSSKFSQRTKKSLPKSHASRSFDMGSDLPYGHSLESKLGSQQSSFIGKRPSGSLNVVSIPTKRVRTAARPRIASPFGSCVAGGVQLLSKTDASSGDTSSFHEDQASVHGVSQPRKILEVESTGDFVKQLPFDTTDVSMKPKKKKAKHLGYGNTLNSIDSVGFATSGKGSTFEQRWQLNSMVQHEQKDFSRKRLENQQLESNGNTGMYGQHAAKKPKLLKQLPDASLETTTPATSSIPSPVASQMSNMTNPNKLIKIIANRDRGRKAKVLKMSAGQSGSGSPWSVYEDQALVVLVHDMGPNWELVSDALNSTLQFKCVFRKPKECKDRHKIIMDRSAGDGADSAEDSGSSQPYNSSLPGIPKGSARQLLQHLQGPMEEDTLKAHFEKIILIGQHLRSRRNQSDNHEVKQISTVHGSHMLALSHACPNNLNGGFLTPLDLCDMAISNPDVISPGYQMSHTSGLAVTNHQGSVTPVLPASGANTMLQGSSGMILGSSLPSASAAFNGPARDMHRYGVPRPSCSPVDEQQRMHQYSQMLTNRNMQQPSATVPGHLPAGSDRGVRMLPGANGMGMMCGTNRAMAMPRPGFPGIGSPAMLNTVSSSGNVLSSNGVGMPSTVNIHNGSVSGQGNQMMRPREAMQMLRPGQNPDEHRQMIMQELQMQVTQGNGPGVIPYSGMNTSFANQTVPSVQTFPVQHQQQQQIPQQSHVLGNPHHPHHQGTNHNPHQQAYAIRLAKERHLQQRLLQQQQQQFPASNMSMPHSQPQLQNPMSPVQNNSQNQQQSSVQSVSLSTPSSQHPLTPPLNPTALQVQPKQQHGPHGLGRNPQTGGALPNQMLKQRQHQQLQQQSRQHLPQKEQSQQQAKLMKGLGRGSNMMHQNLPIDVSHVNGLSPAAGIQVAEKSEQPVMHLMQGPGLFPGSGRNPVPPGKQLVSQGSQPLNQVQQQKLSRLPQSSMKQQMQMPPHLDNKNQGQVQVPSNHGLLASQQPIPSPSLPMASQQQKQLHRQTSQSQQAVQMVLHQNLQTSSDTLMQSPADQAEASSQLMNSTFQMGADTTVPQSSVSNGGVPSVSSATSPPSQWRTEPMYDTSSMSPSAHLASMGNSHQSNSTGIEPLPSTGQRIAARGQLPGSIPVHGHNVGGHLPQQPLSQQQQLNQPPLQQQQQLGQAGQGGNLHSQPPISGPG